MQSENPILLIITLVGAITSLVAAFVSMRSENRKGKLDTEKLHMDQEKQYHDFVDKVNEDTVGLYQRLSEQYKAITEKDKKLLKMVSSVIRKLLVLEMSLGDIIQQIEQKMGTHEEEACSISCQYYQTMNTYILSRVSDLESKLSDTIKDINVILLNGHEEKEDAS